jgi:dipeptidyl aminopeptidase/acylaminoacyl peptidase
MASMKNITVGRFAIIIILLMLIVRIIPAAEKKHAITFEDFFSMKRIGGFSVSPDGKLAAYDLTVPNIAENNFKTDIYLLDLKTKKSTLFTRSEKSSSHPIWSEDGKTLYFNRGGQIWRKELSADSAVQVINFVGGASGAVIRSDGKKILFSTEVYPDCETIDCLKKKNKKKEESKVKARIINHLFYRHWNRWLDGKRNHIFMADIDGENLKDVTPGDYDSPPLDLGSDHDYTFSSQGGEVAFVRNIDPMPAASTNNDIFILSFKNGSVKKLTENRGNDNNPNYSPDGKYIAFASMERAGFEADKQRLMLYDRSAKTFTDLTEGFNLSVSSILWHPSSKEIFFSAAEHGMINLYKVGVKDRKISAVLKGYYVNGMAFISPKSLLLKIQSADRPHELFVYKIGTKKPQRITHINDKLVSELAMNKLEPFHFIGANGDTVEGFILKPPFFDPKKKYPTIQLIHGGPQGAWGDDFHYRWNYQMFAAPGYVVYAINFHGSRGYGQNFTDAVSHDWGGAPYEDLVKGTQYVMDHYSYVDGSRLGAAGASYGGFMINWIEGHENPFKCLVSHDGVYDQVSMYGATDELWFPEWEFNGAPWSEGSLYQKWSPSNLVENFKTPMLVIHGEKDYRVPYTQGLQLFTALQRRGVDSKLLFFPDEDHFVRKPQNARLWWKTVHDWFAEYLK